MKHAVLSILVSVLGIVWIGYLNIQIADIITEQLNLEQESMNPSLATFPKVYKMSGVIIGLIGIFFGIKGYQKVRALSILGILLSILLIILTFIPIFQYLLADSDLYITIQNP